MMMAMSPRATACAIVGLALSMSAGIWAIAADSTSGIKGVWRGPWYLGMTSGTGVLTITNDVPVEGSLQLINNDTFGEAPVALSDVHYDGVQLRFRAKGADGRMLSGQLPVTSDAKAMKGFVKYGGYNLKFEFVRQP